MFKVLKDGKAPTRSSAYVNLYASHDCVIGVGNKATVGLGVSVDFETFMDDYPQILKPSGDTWLDFMASHYLQLMISDELAEKGLIQPAIKIVGLDYKDEIKIAIHNPVQTKPIYEDLMSGGSRQCGLGVSSANLYTITRGEKIAQIALLEHKSYLLGASRE